MAVEENRKRTRTRWSSVRGGEKQEDEGGRGRGRFRIIKPDEYSSYFGPWDQDDEQVPDDDSLYEHFDTVQGFRYHCRKKTTQQLFESPDPVGAYALVGSEYLNHYPPLQGAIHFRNLAVDVINRYNLEEEGDLELDKILRVSWINKFAYMKIEARDNKTGVVHTYQLATWDKKFDGHPLVGRFKDVTLQSSIAKNLLQKKDEAKNLLQKKDEARNFGPWDQDDEQVEDDGHIILDSFNNSIQEFRCHCRKKCVLELYEHPSRIVGKYYDMGSDCVAPKVAKYYRNLAWDVIRRYNSEQEARLELIKILKVNCFERFAYMTIEAQDNKTGHVHTYQLAVWDRGSDDHPVVGRFKDVTFQSSPLSQGRR